MFPLFSISPACVPVDDDTIGESQAKIKEARDRYREKIKLDHAQPSHQVLIYTYTYTYTSYIYIRIFYRLEHVLRRLPLDN